ncbi:1424_t:CDS:2, partial [Dentiscutata erythropus]
GKTLTAETVSEYLHRPLYAVSVGELGRTSYELEAKLGEILEVANVWNAVIHIDEGSSKNDVNRYGMVGIFLRLLEYHQGFLFLTTNRARAQIWRTFLDHADGKDKSHVDIDKLKQRGLEIKTAIKLAKALATKSDPNAKTVLAAAAHKLDSKLLCRPFNSPSPEDIKEIIQEAGLENYGATKLFDGQTGYTRILYISYEYEDRDDLSEKIGVYLRSLEAIANNEEGQRSKRAKELLGKYRENDRSDRQKSRNWNNDNFLISINNSTVSGNVQGIVSNKKIISNALDQKDIKSKKDEESEMISEIIKSGEGLDIKLLKL